MSPPQQLARGLPDELLDIIVDALYPGDIVSFASTCQRFHRLSKVRLRRHRENHVAWKRVAVTSRGRYHLPDDVKDFENPLELLVELDADPSLFYYIRLLEFDDMLEDYVKEYSNCNTSSFPNLVRLSPLLQQNVAYREQCIRGISEGNVDDCLMLILSLAAELTHLRTWNPTYSRYLTDGAGSQAVPCCPNLQWIEAHSLRSNENSINHFIHWTRLPRLETMCIIGKDTAAQAHTFHDWPPQRPLGLSNLYLFESYEDGEGLAHILAGLQGLKSFIYTRALISLDSYLWHTTSALEALERAASHTLQSLTLQMPFPPYDRLTSLKAFKTLQHFRGSFCVFQYTSSRDARGKYVQSLDLGAVFPSSLIHLELSAFLPMPLWQHDRPMNISFDNIESCPNLKHVVLSKCNLSPEELDTLQAQNIIVEQDLIGRIYHDSTYDGTLPEEWWHNCLWTPEYTVLR